jgi:cyclomaltodextrinase / maltogenic alpha-amylase / neopullulanase
MNQLQWQKSAVFYHLYPLGCLGAAETNDFSSPAEPKLKELTAWIPYLRDLGVNALYLGPVFESTRHGYDTADFFNVDRRLGTNEDLVNLTAAFEENGIKVVLDAVFHHTGRDFWAFRDVLKNGADSSFRGWFYLDFDSRSPYGDGFAYQGWNGNLDLVKMNVQVPAVKQHIFEAVAFWMDHFRISGLRLDAADALDQGFQRELTDFCKSRHRDFWLMGEVVHGDYRGWVQPGVLDSVTNYELYKGLWSSHNDNNYFEIAYSLNREFGAQGIYRDLPLYNFADNHDVERVASILHKPAHLYPLYLLLFTAPGVPSIYYGSEFGVHGQKKPGSDRSLRPEIRFEDLPTGNGGHPLHTAIRKFIQLRHNYSALRHGSYRQLLVRHQQLAFERCTPAQRIVVAVNAANELCETNIEVPVKDGTIFTDVLEDNKEFRAERGGLRLPLYPSWGRVLIQLPNHFQNGSKS